LKKPRKGSRRRPAKAAASAQDHAAVTYPEARARFLASAEDTDNIEWLVAVGRYVWDRWLAEEQARDPNKELDENEVWHVWDQCTEKQIRDLRAEAGTALKEYVEERGLQAFLASWNSRIDPIRGLISAIKWTLEQSLRAVVGAIALILMGAMFVAVAPSIVKRAHSTLESVLADPNRRPN